MQKEPTYEERFATPAVHFHKPYDHIGHSQEEVWRTGYNVKVDMVTPGTSDR